MQSHDVMPRVGSYWDHVVPGLLFLAWGIHWHWVTLRANRPRPASSSLFTRLETIALMICAVAGAIGEVWWAGWRMVDGSLINYQHATMYLAFAAAGAADLGVRSGRLPTGTERAVAALAFALTALQFLMHFEHSLLSAALHRLLIVLLLATSAAFVFAWRGVLVRSWLVASTGTWFLVIAWLLYRSGVDTNAPASAARASLFFAWTVLGVGSALAATQAWISAGGDAAGSVSS